MPRGYRKTPEQIVPERVASEMAEARSIAESEGIRMTPEDSALRRRLEDRAIQEEGTDFGKHEQNADLMARYRNARKPTPGVNSTRERLDPSIDKYSPTRTTNKWDSEEAARRYHNVGPGRHVVWKHRPEIYKDEFDEVADVLDQFPDAKIVTRKDNGKPLHSRDLVAVSIPKKFENARQEAEREEHDEWEEMIRQGTQHGSVTKNSPNLIDLERQAAENARIRSQRLGVGYDGNSPTAGTPLAVAERMISLQDKLAMEARARSGNRHHSYEEIEERNKAASRGRQTFGGLTGQADKWERSSDKQRAAKIASRTAK